MAACKTSDQRLLVQDPQEVLHCILGYLTGYPACSLYSCILCILCVCFVFVPYALTLPVSGLSFMSIKICSVLFCS